MKLTDAIRGRRDVRTGFRLDPVPDDVLLRVLDAAHHAPSVGFSQPWDFLVVRDRATRERVRTIVRRERDRYAASLPAARAGRRCRRISMLCARSWSRSRACGSAN